MAQKTLHVIQSECDVCKNTHTGTRELPSDPVLPVGWKTVRFYDEMNGEFFYCLCNSCLDAVSTVLEARRK